MVTIVFPFPPNSALFPNARHRRGGFYKGIKASEKERKRAKEHAEKYAPKIAITSHVSVKIHAKYGYNRSTPDLDATLSACKPVLDGVVDAKVLKDDDQIKRLTVTHEKVMHKRKAPRHPGEITITIEEI